MGNRRRNCSRQLTNTLVMGVPVLVVAGALVLSGSGVIAADRDRLYQDEVADAAGGVEAEELSDADLHGFIEAANEVQSIRALYAEQIRTAEPGERASLQVDAAEKMATAIEDQGLDVSEYRAIGYLLENDAGLSDRLDRVAEKAR